MIVRRRRRGGYVSDSEVFREIIREADRREADEGEAAFRKLAGPGIPGEEPLEQILAAKHAARREMLARLPARAAKVTSQTKVKPRREAPRRS